MFAETTVTANPTMIGWNQVLVILAGAGSIGLGGVIAAARWLVKRTVTDFDLKLTRLNEGLEAMDESKVDKGVCAAGVRGVHEKIDNLKDRMDEHYGLLTKVLDRLNGIQYVVPPKDPDKE